MGILGVGLFPVQSGGSLIINLQLFRYRNLALIGIFLLFLRARHVSTLRRVSIHPMYICMPPVHSFAPHMFTYPLYIQTPPYVQIPPYVPNASLFIYVLGSIYM